MIRLDCGGKQRNGPHLRDDLLILTLDEGPPSLGALRHLRECRRCSDRQRELERALTKISEDLHRVMAELGPLSPTRRSRFIRELDALLGSLAARSWWKRLLDHLRVPAFARSVPSVASGSFAVCVALILLSYWYWRLPTVSASELLARAVASESGATRVADGKVVRQRVRIKALRKTVDRIVYRDVSGLLHPKSAGAGGTEEADLADHLALAGVDWDDPLSAVSFKNWHDRQAHSTDEVRSGGKGFLTIRTRLTDADVIQESLTVTDDGFLAVERNIEYRDIGDVEITDAGREALSSEMVEELSSRSQPREVAERKNFPGHALSPSKVQLDEAELNARLALSQQSADTGEQIDIKRSSQGVLVTGLVDTDKRERQLKESLLGIPFLKVTLKNFDEYKSTPHPTADHEVPEESAAAKISPLERYFVDEGRNRDDLSLISAGLFNASLEINRSSRAIEELLSRFCNDEELTPLAVQSRNVLLAHNVSRLRDGLSEQQNLLKQVGITFETTSMPQSSLGASGYQLTASAERNAIAVKELISADNESSGLTTQSIAMELGGTIDLLRSVALSAGPGCGVPAETKKP